MDDECTKGKEREPLVRSTLPARSDGKDERRDGWGRISLREIGRAHV